MRSTAKSSFAVRANVAQGRHAFFPLRERASVSAKSIPLRLCDRARRSEPPPRRARRGAALGRGGRGAGGHRERGEGPRGGEEWSRGVLARAARDAGAGLAGRESRVRGRVPRDLRGVEFGPPAGRADAHPPAVARVLEHHQHCRLAAVPAATRPALSAQGTGAGAGSQHRHRRRRGAGGAVGAAGQLALQGSWRGRRCSWRGRAGRGRAAC